MPFTFSHPAAVLPFNKLVKNYFSVTGLVIGSITPDFEYFIKLKQSSVFSHTWAGMFYFDLPVSLILYFTFIHIVKDTLIINLPDFLNRRFSHFIGAKRSLTRKNLILIIVSLAIGTLSHLVWDKVTHHSSKLLDNSMEYYTFLWDANSIVGAIIICIYTWQMRQGEKNIANNRMFYWLIVIFMMVSLVYINSFYTNELRSLGVSAISGFLGGLLLNGLLTIFISKKQYQ